jgi:ketosteroid isomerase-like protein
MCIRKRTLVAWGMVVVSLVLLAGVLGMPKTTKPAAAQVDWCQKVQQVNDAFNRGEIDLVLESFADDMVVVAAPLCAPCVGKDAFRNHVEYQVALDTQLTITSCEVSGSTIAVTYEMRARDVREAGVDRIIMFDAYEMEGDTVVSARSVGVDMEDPQTAQYVTWIVVHGVTLAMGPGRDADQSPGLASLELYPDFSEVSLGIAPGPTGVPQPANIHEGTCADLGPVAFALKDLAGGQRSQTLLDGVPGSDLQTGNLAIAVQKSHEEPDVYVACADIPAAAAAVPPAEAPAVAPAPAAELPSAGSGGLLGEEGSSLPTWWYALAAGGTLLIMGGLAGQWRARRRP